MNDVHSSIETRLRAIENHPNFQTLCNHVPPSASRRSIIFLGSLFLVPWVGILGVCAVVDFLTRPRRALRWVVLLASVVFGVVWVVRLVRNPPGWRLAPLLRFAAVVSQKCAEPEGGQRSRTWYSATLATKLHPAREFAVDRELYEVMRLGDAGVAFARGDKLHEFLPIEP